MTDEEFYGEWTADEAPGGTAQTMRCHAFQGRDCYRHFWDASRCDCGALPAFVDSAISTVPLAALHAEAPAGGANRKPEVSHSEPVVPIASLQALIEEWTAAIQDERDMANGQDQRSVDLFGASADAIEICIADLRALIA